MTLKLARIVFFEEDDKKHNNTLLDGPMDSGYNMHRKYY